MSRQLDALDVEERGAEPVAKGSDARDRDLALRLDELERTGHADGARHVLRACASVALLRSAVLLGEDVGATPDPQRADPLRPLGLVRREGHEVRPQRGDVEVDPRRGLDRVHVEQHAAMGADDLHDVVDRLERADLVVREHHRHERRALRDRAVDVGRVDAAVAVHGHLHDLEPEVLQVGERVTDRVVLHRGRDDPVATRLAGPGGALEREVVGLGATAREHELARLGADGPAKPLVRVVERLTCRPPERVARRRVAEHAPEVGRHRLEDVGAQRGRGGVVEIDRHRPGIVVRPASPPIRPGAVTTLAG